MERRCVAVGAQSIDPISLQLFTAPMFAVFDVFDAFTERGRLLLLLWLVRLPCQEVPAIDFHFPTSRLVKPVGPVKQRRAPNCLRIHLEFPSDPGLAIVYN